MRRFGLLVGGLALAAAAPAGAEGAAYPIAQMLDAFKAACPSRAAAVAALDGGAIAGWERLDPAKTPVGGLLAFGREQGAKMLDKDGRVLGPNVVHHRTVAGEALYLIVSGVETGGTTVRGCRLYDPGEQRAPDEAAVAGWVGRTPDAEVKRAELTKLTWNGGFGAGQDSFELYLVPKGSPVIAMTQIDGLAVKADWVDIGGAPASGADAKP